jgi:glutamate dehydrogenase/leucine dehydrogenase
MEGALEFLEMGTLNGKTVAIQGAGNVGRLSLKSYLSLLVIIHVHLRALA